VHTDHPRILALDLMSNLGWACRSDDGQIHYGTETFKVPQVESPGFRWLRFRNWLKRIYETIHPTTIFFEEVKGFPSKNRGRDSRVYYGFEHSLTAFCVAASLDHHGVPVGTIKKFIAGGGNASKEAVIRAVQAQGHRPADSNQADAIALLLYAEAYMKGDVE
jgi:Holliday junction resolvasome RuvABC endonuclease subunit